MTATDTLLRTALDKAKPLLDRFGILAAPGRAALDARRALTIERTPDEVRQLLTDPSQAAMLFARAATVRDPAVAGTPAVPGPVAWQLGEWGRAEATLRGTAAGTEVLMEVHLEKLAEGARPRYADNAGVIAIRALHRAKSFLETGETPTLRNNPAARSAPDPYGD